MPELDMLDQLLHGLPSDTCSKCRRVMTTPEVEKYGMENPVLCENCQRIAYVTPLGLQDASAMVAALVARIDSQNAEISRWITAFERVFAQGDRRAERITELETALRGLLETTTLRDTRTIGECIERNYAESILEHTE